MNNRVINVYATISVTVINEVTLFPTLSITCPINRDPIISPIPKDTIENIDFINYSLLSVNGIESEIMGTKSPV